MCWSAMYALGSVYMRRERIANLYEEIKCVYGEGGDGGGTYIL